MNELSRRCLQGLMLLGALGLAQGPGCARPLGWWFPGEETPDAGVCGQPADFACTRREDGPCSRFVTVAAECAPGTGWQCPADTQVLVEPEAPPESCLPFYGETSPFVWLGSTGTPVERGDGRCMWIMSDGVAAADDVHLSHPATLLPAMPTPSGVGGCLPGVQVLGGEVPFSVADESELGVEVIASMGDGLVFGGQTWIYYRHWVWDPAEVFGVRLLGTRLARYDHPTESVQFLEGFLWGAEEAFGDAAVVVDGVPYVYGCHGPSVMLSHDCFLARLAGEEADLGDPTSYEHYIGDGQWSADMEQEATVFDSGPHRTAVRYHPGLGRYVMVFAYGFGDRMELRTAPAPEGPWVDEGVLADCELPPDDPEAFCATPALHLELMADWRPGQWAITYEVGTLAPDGEARRAANPAAYWPRLVRVQAY